MFANRIEVLPTDQATAELYIAAKSASIKVILDNVQAAKLTLDLIDRLLKDEPMNSSTREDLTKAMKSLLTDAYFMLDK